jgi:uncharacterized membrane protein
MRAGFPGGLTRFLWLVAAGALACTDPNTASFEADEPAQPFPRPTGIPAGFLELWPGGPVLPDQPRIRSTLAAQARTHAAGMRGAPRMAYSVVQTSTAESLDGGAAEGSQAMDVNRSGTVVGTVMDALPGGTPVTWSPGAVTPMPLPKRDEWEDPLPAALNDAGDIAGHAQILLYNGTYRSRVVRWGSDGSLTTLPPLAGLEEAWYEAVDIAPSGDILGQVDAASPYPPSPDPARVILWQDGIASEVGPSGESAVPIAVNSSGTILATLSSGPAVRSPTGTWTPLASPPGDLAAFATDLGEDGTVVGGALDHATSTYVIVRWAPDGTPTVIPPPTPGQHGFASAINYSGRILLTVFEPGFSVPGAYLLDGTDYSPLPAAAPADASALTLTGLSDMNVAIGYWQLTFVRQAVRWTIEFPNTAPSNRALGFMQDYVRVADHADLDLRDTWTLEAWVYPRTAGSGTDEDVISKWAGVTDAAYILQIDGATGKLRLVTNNGVGQTIVLSNAPLKNGVWQHVAATFSNGVVQLYLNGVRVRRATAVRTPINSSQPLAFGREGNFSGGTLDGRLDEIRIWRVVRTASQIANWRRRSLSGTENGLVGYWRFDEGQGQVAGDATGRGHEGRLGETTGVDSWDPRWTSVGAPLR